MANELKIFFRYYPDKVTELIEQTRKHGDPYFAAKLIGIQRLWVILLLEYKGSMPKIAKAAVDLDLAVFDGSSNREAYAKNLFILTLSKHSSISEAVSSQPWYKQSFFTEQRKKDSVFDDAWIIAQEQAVDSLRLEAWRRAAEGIDEPQIHQGQLQYQYNPETHKDELVTVKKYSDGMLQMLLKRYDPAFKDKIQVDQNTTLGGGVQLDLTQQALAQLSEDELKILNKFVDLQTKDEDYPE